MTADGIDYAERAAGAIEFVCSGDLSRMSEFYSPEFVDHVNEMTFFGYDGGRESLGFYLALFKQLRLRAAEQVTEGNRVASRWELTGSYRGREVTLRGITISHFGEDGRIVEDHGHSDSLALPRQLGVLRTLAVGLEILTRRLKLPRGALGKA